MTSLFYREGFLAGQAAMRERAAQTAEVGADGFDSYDFTVAAEVAAKIRALPLPTPLKFKVQFAGKGSANDWHPEILKQEKHT